MLVNADIRVIVNGLEEASAVVEELRAAFGDRLAMRRPRVGGAGGVIIYGELTVDTESGGGTSAAGAPRRKREER